MIEIEVKAYVEDIDRLEKQLQSLKCQFIKTTRQIDSVYLPGGIKYENLIGKRVVARIREEEGGETSLTVKQTLNNNLENIERKVIVQSAHDTESVLQLAGFNKIVKIDKVRKKFKYNDYTIYLDEVKGLGDFIEVEKLINEEKKEKGLGVQERLLEFLKELGISKDKVTFDTYYDILLKN